MTAWLYEYGKKNMSKHNKQGVCDLGLWGGALHGFNRFITLHNDSDSESYVAITWLEVDVKENSRQEAPTKEQLHELDCIKDLDLFETMCKILNTPMEVKKIWARRRLMSWFRANMTAWLYEYGKKNISKHSRVYCAYQLDIGAGAFKRAFVTHQNAVTLAVKMTSGTNDCDGREREELLKKDLEKK